MTGTSTLDTGSVGLLALLLGGYLGGVTPVNHL
jgi:hypothetical protein